MFKRPPLEFCSVIMLLLLLVRVSADESPPLAKPAQVAIFLDTSGSMAGARATAMKEAAKLAVAILDSEQEVVVVPFNHEARAISFSLRSIQERRVAMAYVDGLVINGGTDYLAALRAAKLAPSVPGIFLSDGEHNGDATPVLQFLKANRPGPLYTVAIETPPSAERLLKEMAALTGGNHVSVANSERLVTAFLELAKQLGNYRTFSPQEDSIDCKGAMHQVIAFGLDTTVAVEGIQPSQTATYSFSLPGEHVAMVVAQMGNQSCDLTIKAQQKRSANGRLAAILRNDLSRATMSLSVRDGKAPAGGEIQVKTHFSDPQGKDLDARKTAGLSSVVKVTKDGKVVAQATSSTNPNEPFLRATVQLPKQTGPVTIENETTDASKGPAFKATQKQTIFLEEPLIMTVTPSRLEMETKDGPFTVSLAVQLNKKVPVAFSAELQGTSHLRLLSSNSKEQSLVLQLEALQVGELQGYFLIHGSATSPILSAKVPFTIHVKESLAGLALPQKRSLHLGTYLANSGKTVLPALLIPTQDEEAAAYVVELGDFSDGANVVLVSADKVKIQPTKGKPAEVCLTAQLGNVPPGNYQAKLNVVAGKGPSSRQWLTTIQLTLSEPLTASAVDFAKVEAGRTALQTVTLRNSSAAALADLKFLKGYFPGKEKELALILPKEIPALPANGTKALEVKVAVSPQTAAGGVHTGVLLLQRGTGAEIRVPLRIEIAAAGQGPSGLVVAPQEVLLKGKPGQIVRFTVSIRLSPAAGIDSAKIAGTFQGFQDKTGRAVRIETGLQEHKDQKIDGQSPFLLQGFLLCPDAPGRYVSHLTLTSDRAGTAILPLALDIEN